MSTDNFLMQGGTMKQKSLSFFIGTVLVYVSASFTETAQAGRYELIKGKGVEVCEAYRKNLESFNDPNPIACERKINPEFKDFEKPVWEKVDLEQHRELFRRLLRYQSPDRDQFHKGSYDDPELNIKINDHREQGYRFVSRTKIDIDSDKRLDDVLIYRLGSCPDGPPFHATNLYILIEDPSVKDAMIHAARPTEKRLRTEVSLNDGTDTTVDIFRYKGMPYIDKYCLSKQPGCSDKDTLIVYKYGSVRNPKSTSVLDEWSTGFNKICEFRYLKK